MKKIFLFACLALIFAACQESLEDKCEREAKAYTAKKCPYKMDQNTTLDSLTFDKATHTFQYYYRLTGNADAEGVLDSVQVIKLLRDELKNTTAMKLYKDNGYNFSYTFLSEKEPTKVLYNVVLTKKDYQ